MAVTTANAIGRTRRRLAEMLADNGYVVAPENLNSTNPGFYRGTGPCCWYATGVDANGALVDLVSWDTMASCVRNGFTVTPSMGSFEVISKGGSQ